MAYGAITSPALGLTLQISYNMGYVSLLNESMAEFRNISSLKVREGSVSKATEYLHVSAIPYSNFQFVDPGATDGAFISADSSTVAVKQALMKEMNSVVKVQQNVWARAAKAPKNEKYFEPIMLEQHYSQLINANRLAIAYQGDGSGAIAAISSATPSVAISGGYVTYSLRNGESYKGFVRWLKENQRVNFYDPDGTARVVVDSGSNNHSYFKVEEVDNTLSAPAVKLGSYTSAGALNTDFDSITNLAADDLLYDADQATNGAVPDTTSVSDWGDLVIPPGLISLSAIDGRTVNQVVHSGLSAGTHKDVSSALLFTHIGEILTDLKIRNSIENFKWGSMEAAPEVFDYLAEINEGQRFLLPGQNDRGAQAIFFNHRSSKVELLDNRYTPSYRMYFVPTMSKAPGNSDASKMAPVQFRFSEWDFIKTPDGQNWRMAENSSGVEIKAIRMDMHAFGTFLTTRPSAIGVLKNFTI